MATCQTLSQRFTEDYFRHDFISIFGSLSPDLLLLILGHTTVSKTLPPITIQFTLKPCPLLEYDSPRASPGSGSHGPSLDQGLHMKMERSAARKERHGVVTF